MSSMSLQTAFSSNPNFPWPAQRWGFGGRQQSNFSHANYPPRGPLCNTASHASNRRGYYGSLSLIAGQHKDRRTLTGGRMEIKESLQRKQNSERLQRVLVLTRKLRDPSLAKQFTLPSCTFIGRAMPGLPLRVLPLIRAIPLWKLAPTTQQKGKHSGNIRHNNHVVKKVYVTYPVLITYRLAMCLPIYLTPFFFFFLVRKHKSPALPQIILWYIYTLSNY